LRETTTRYRICGSIALIGGDILSKGFADEKWTRVEFPPFWFVVIDKVGNQLIFNFGIIIGGFEGSW